MTVADKARAAAINCEMVKYAYRQSKDGVVVSFVVHPNDVPDGLATAPLGSRYVVALVQVGDDEQPVNNQCVAKAMGSEWCVGRCQNSRDCTARPAPLQEKGAKPRQEPPVGAKRAWEEMQPAQQAGIRSHDVRFAAFLEEEYAVQWREHGDAADCIRAICEVHSRAELGTDHTKRVLWHQLDRHYQAWEAKERLNA